MEMMDTLREKAQRAATKEESILYGGAGTIASSPALDGSAAVSYFLDGTPDEESFSVSDIPLGGGLRWLVGGTSGVFIEAGEAVARELAWGTLLTKSARTEALAEEIRRAGSLGVVDTEIYAGEPGLAVMEPGLLSKIGVFAYLDSPALDESRRSFYEHLFAEMVELEELGGILQIMAFAELEVEPDSSVLIEPSVIWYLPVDREGYIVELGGGSDDLMMVAPGVESTQDLEDVMDLLAETQRPVLAGMLFALGCVGAAGSDALSPELELDEEDSVGAFSVLRMGGLTNVLREQGRVSDLGLSHALTVCRDRFEATY